MMKVIKDMPSGIVAIHASGTITQEDYKNILIPATEQSKPGKIRMLFFLEGIDGFEFSAMWEDFMYGIRNWRAFSHFALVTDNKMIRTITTCFMPLMPCEVRIYNQGELDQAAKWLEHPDAVAA